ncbi:MAG TPA: zf-HC2 domain-containing protein [Terriglobia bacterium]|nr:zf-HC2 domain-containing protein [Terriglobia bacterium]
MQHTEADQNLAVERYLLGEMTASEVEQFEEHLFLCPECAESVRTGATFVENARAVFKEPATQAETESVRRPMKSKPQSWWRMLMAPSFAPALAALVLLCVAGYQQLVVIRGLKTQLAEVTAPQPLASFALHAVSRGAQQTIVVPPDVHFIDLYFDVATESASGYSCAVLDGSGSIKLTERVPPPRSDAGATLHLLIGRSRLPAGDYTLVVSAGSPGAGEIGRYPFKVDYQ